MKILLIHPATDCLKENPKRRRWEERPVPPMGLLYIASYLLKYRYDVSLNDCCVSTTQELKDKIKQADIIGIYASTAFTIEAVNLINYIRKNYNKKIVITGGPHSTISPEYFLNNGADFSIRGEGEEVMLKLVRALKDKKDYKNILGISYKENGKIINNPIHPPIDLNSLPMPARHLIPMERYFERWNRGAGYTCVYLVTSRGCPYNCKFCSKEIFGNSYRAITAKKVVDEVEFVKKTYNPDKIDFIDDLFTQNKERVMEICKEIKKRKLKFKWNCESRANIIDYEMFKVMKKAGCQYITLGVESGSPKVLKYLNKAITPEQIIKSAKLIKKAGIKVGFHIIFGAPPENREDIDLTRKMLKEAKPDYISRSFLTPLPGTPIWEELKDKLLVDPDKLLYTDYLPFKHDNFTKEEITELSDMVYKEFLKNRFFNYLFFHPIKMLKAGLNRIKTRYVKFKYKNDRELN